MNCSAADTAAVVCLKTYTSYTQMLTAESERDVDSRDIGRPVYDE